MTIPYIVVYCTCNKKINSLKDTTMTTTRTINHDTVNAIANLTPDNLYDTLANLSLEDAYKMLDILVEEQRQRRDFHRQILINILVKETYKL